MVKSLDDLRRVTGLSHELCVAGILSGQLPGYRVNSRYFVPDEAFDDLLHCRWVQRPQPLFILSEKGIDECQTDALSAASSRP